MKYNQEEEEEESLIIGKDNQELSLSKIEHSPSENSISSLPQPEGQRGLRDSWLKWMVQVGFAGGNHIVFFLNVSWTKVN